MSYANLLYRERDKRPEKNGHTLVALHLVDFDAFKVV